MRAERWQRAKPLLEQAIALDLPERSTFLDRMCEGDPELRDEMESLISCHEQIGTTFLNTPAANFKAVLTDTPPRTGRKIGAYQLVEEIGHGGMGEVYRAVRADGQYTKDVAIKLVRSGFEGGSLSERFRNERQILASLDHPNIARLLDGGTTEDGVPYLVMDLIHGAPIDQYCDEHSLAVSERLQLFRQICDAVRYAHQRLVIHRDIKPGNILVSDDGVPKLLDFGIAKLLEPSANTGATVAGVMTPEYASPEQIRGEPITTATDLYSLGVVLYRLLTGRSPYTSDTSTPHGLARAICDEDPLKPSTAIVDPSAEASLSACFISSKREDSPAKLRKRLRGDLDNIVLRALHKEALLRYASVEKLSDDLQRHLDGLPVAARQDFWTCRAERFAKRHKLGLAATALILIALLAGGIATLREARIAAAHEQRAEKRFNDVRKLANSLIFEVHDSIQDLPGTTPARKLIMQRALEYLDSLAQESADDASLQRELADAYVRIGSVQGGPYGSNLGDPGLALKSYQQALSIQQTLLAAGTNELSDSVRLAETLRLLSNVLSSDGDTSGALQHSRRAVRILEPLLSDHADDPRLLTELIRDYSTVADTLASSLSVSTQLDVASALPVRQRQLAAAEQLTRLQPDRTEAERMLAGAQSAVGDTLLLTGQRKDALDHYLRAQQIFEKLETGSPSTKALLDLHDSYYRLSPVLLANRQINQALASSRKALDIAQKLSSADEQNTLASLLMAANYSSIADIDSRLGRRRAAYESITKAMNVDAELGKKHYGAKEFKVMRCERLRTGGDVAYRFGDYSQALRYYGEDTDLLLPLAKQNPATGAFRLLLAVAYNGTAAVQIKLHQFSAAATTYQRALRVLAPDLTSKSVSGDVLYAIATSYAGLGDVERSFAKRAVHNQKQQMDHLRQAYSWYELSLKTWRQLKEPGLVSPSGYNCTPFWVVTARQTEVAAKLHPAKQY